MPLYQIFHIGLGRKLIPLLLLAMVSGICNLLLIKTISEILTAEQKELNGLIPYAVILLVFVIVSRAFGIMLLRAGVDMTARIRTNLIRAVAGSKYEDFERTGHAKTLGSLTNDTQTLADAPETLISMATSLATILASLTYLAWLSPKMFLLLLLFIAIGVGLFEILIRGARSHLDAARKTLDQFLAGVDDLFSGFKELYINSHKRHHLVEGHIVETINQNREHELRGGYQFVTANVVSNGFIFIVMGLFVSAMLLFFDTKQDLMITYMFVMLYLIGPIRIVQSGVQVMVALNVAATRVLELFKDLDMSLKHPVDMNLVMAPQTRFRSLKLSHISFHYPGEGGFRVGPLNLTINQGEVVFVTGGNGSGKTTLIRLILGLSKPSQGQIWLNDRPVDTEALSSYRNLYAAVFTDFHLFQKLYGLGNPTPDKVKALLQRMELEHKIQLETNAFIKLDLSQGQRRRLALVTALLEDRPVIVLDELAADQDPEFRHKFYTQILPELKTAGKTVLAVTHDDRYFHCCDRLIHLESGTIAKETRDLSTEGGTRVTVPI